VKHEVSCCSTHSETSKVTYIIVEHVYAMYLLNQEQEVCTAIIKKVKE